MIDRDIVYCFGKYLFGVVLVLFVVCIYVECFSEFVYCWYVEMGGVMDFVVGYLVVDIDVYGGFFVVFRMCCKIRIIENWNENNFCLILFCVEGYVGVGKLFFERKMCNFNYL